MRVEKDYKELLDLLNRHEVRYCIIGAYALALHARPRVANRPQDRADIEVLERVKKSH